MQRGIGRWTGRVSAVQKEYANLKLYADSPATWLEEEEWVAGVEEFAYGGRGLR